MTLMKLLKTKLFIEKKHPIKYTYSSHGGAGLIAKLQVHGQDQFGLALFYFLEILP
jgi:hypothetical protein